jgi:ectoine hydroxylase-related dioxygenase (phytanoyl-CoA dioxygenase family)
VHHVMTVHSSGQNQSASRRVGIAFRYCGAHVRQKGDIGDTATLVGGTDQGTFPLELAPKVEFGEEEMKRHAKAVGQVGPTELIKSK